MNYSELEDMYSWEDIRSRFDKIFIEDASAGELAPIEADVLKSRLENLRNMQDKLFAHMVKSAQLSPASSKNSNRMRYKPVSPLRAVSTFIEQFTLEVRISGVIQYLTRIPINDDKDSAFLFFLILLYRRSYGLFPFSQDFVSMLREKEYRYYVQEHEKTFGLVIALLIFGYINRNETSVSIFSEATLILRRYLYRYNIDVSEEWANEVIRAGGLVMENIIPPQIIKDDN